MAVVAALAFHRSGGTHDDRTRNAVGVTGGGDSAISRDVSAKRFPAATLLAVGAAKQRRRLTLFARRALRNAPSATSPLLCAHRGGEPSSRRLEPGGRRANLFLPMRGGWPSGAISATLNA